MPIEIREVDHGDRDWVARRLSEHWGGPMLVADGRSFDAARLPGLIAGERAGVLLYEVEEARAELVLVEAMERRRGVGTALVNALLERLRALGVRALHLTTTNDNLDALRFYQRRGFVLAESRPCAIDRARVVKPSIPATGAHGIPIRDELRLVRWLGDDAGPMPGCPSAS